MEDECKGRSRRGGVMDFQSTLQTILLVCNLVAILYGFKKFLSRPHDTLEQRVNMLEVRIQDVERVISKNTDEIQEHKDDLELLRECVEALIDFELAYCISTHYDAEGIDDLRHARKVLRESKE